MQLVATAALFLAAKSEETARPLNNVLRASCEIFHKQDLAVLSYLLPVVSTSALSLCIIDHRNILRLENCEFFNILLMHMVLFGRTGLSSTVNVLLKLSR